jgi:D-serine deaminase-like pyridoxal phosphate-dependent protein
MTIQELDTPALLIDVPTVCENIRFMQNYATAQGVALRPHTKTHKMPAMALLQESAGAKGITVAKVGEAEVMAANGLKDIFIANEIVGEHKYRRIQALAEKGIALSFGLDSIEQAALIEAAFAHAALPAVVLIEIEVGEDRSGIIEEADFLALLAYLKGCPHIHFKGIFSHEGHSYAAPSHEACGELFATSQQRTLRFAELAAQAGMPCQTVSIGATPSLMHGFPVLKGITELRPGTYIFMDASQGNHIGTHQRCAATVLTTVISRPTATRVITDVGAKGLTMQTRTQGLCATQGLGMIQGYNVPVSAVFDEHAIIYNKEFRDAVRVGDKVQIIPNHICPVVNLYEQAYLVENDTVLESIPVLCRGKLQ